MANVGFICSRTASFELISEYISIYRLTIIDISQNLLRALALSQVGSVDSDEIRQPQRMCYY